jgi:hypothetical protein
VGCRPHPPVIAAKRRPHQSRRPSAAKRIIRAEVSKDTGPIYLQSSFFGAAAAGDGLECLVLLAILTRVGKTKIDIAIQAHVWVILGCRVERISIWRYPYFVHESHPFCGPGSGVCHHLRSHLRTRILDHLRATCKRISHILHYSYSYRLEDGWRYRTYANCASYTA